MTKGKDSSPHQTQRQHYRIHFPTVERPVFEFRKNSYPVIDISEQGMALFVPASDSFYKVTGLITGKVVFRDNETATVTGKVLRTGEDQLVLTLTQGIPLAIIMKQQRFLLQKYGQLEK